MTHGNITDLEFLRKKVVDADGDVLRELMIELIQMLMSAEANGACRADYGSRSEERVNHRNGYRDRPFDTRLGTLDLKVPRLRRGSYYPEWLFEPRRRSERAMFQVITEAWVGGVSTRKMDRLVKSLGIEGISRSTVSEMARTFDERVSSFLNRPLDGAPYKYVWMDGTALKCREQGAVENVSAVLAVGVNQEGYREILGMDVFTRENETGWTEFVRGLVARGLSGVEMVTSDSHPGLKSAISQVLPGSSWNRCYTHFTRNVLDKVPKKAQRKALGMLRSVTGQVDPEVTREQYDRVADTLGRAFPRLADMLDDAREEVLAHTRLPLEHWRKIRTNNPMENLNAQIKRRSRVVGIFPNRASIVRLVGTLLLEQHEDWLAGRRYMRIDSFGMPEDFPDELLMSADLEPECETLRTPH